MSDAVLVIFMEPAPYRIGLVRELRRAWKGPLDVLFIAPSLSQEWATDPGAVGATVLPAGTIRALREVRRRLSRTHYSVLHVAGWGHPVTLGSMLYARRLSVPIVSETDTPAPFSQARWRAAVKALLYPHLFSLPKHFLPAGQRQAAYLRQYGVNDGRISLGKLTVDVSGIAAFARAFTAEDKANFFEKHGIPNSDATTFLFLGRLEPHKGITDLLSAYVRLRTERSDVRLLIAGSGSLERFVRSSASSLRSVYFLRHLKGRSVWDAYCSSDVFVFPTRRDPWGLVANESMAAGLPMIVSDGAGCISDLVVHGKTGLVYRRGSVEDLLTSMRAVAASADLRARLGASAHALISDWTLTHEARIATAAWNKVAETQQVPSSERVAEPWRTENLDTK